LGKYGVFILKKLILLFILSISLFASKIEVEKQIYKQILYDIFPYKQKIYVWVDSKNMSFLNQLNRLKIVTNLQDADILIIKHELSTTNIENKIVFVQSYHLLKLYDSFAIGGFYWQKGRPNLLFLRKNLEKYNIKLDKGFEKYIEDEL
jgi:hypothetical protein